MTENATAREGSETSTGNEAPGKRRAPPRTSRRIATKEAAEDEPEHKIPVKQERKPEKKIPRPKPDPNRETAITENGYALHANGPPLHLPSLFYRVDFVDCIYLISEPPGEPYYIARVMEFLYV